VDEFAVWNRFLNYKEISAVAYSRLNTAYSPLFFQYPGSVGADGLADSWSWHGLPAGTSAIHRGPSSSFPGKSGFQRLVAPAAGGSDLVVRLNVTANLREGMNYLLSFRYRSSHGLQSGTGAYSFGSLPAHNHSVSRRVHQQFTPAYTPVDELNGAHSLQLSVACTADATSSG
jgi:hypothetical protein